MYKQQLKMNSTIHLINDRIDFNGIYISYLITFGMNIDNQEDINPKIS